MIALMIALCFANANDNYRYRPKTSNLKYLIKKIHSSLIISVYLNFMTIMQSYATEIIIFLISVHQYSCPIFPNSLIL